MGPVAVEVDDTNEGALRTFTAGDLAVTTGTGTVEKGGMLAGWSLQTDPADEGYGKLRHADASAPAGPSADR